MSISPDVSGGPLVLVVEDNERNARLTTEILGGNGYQVVVAAEGRQAIELARTLQPQLILMDVQLPGMDGVAVTRILKRDAETAEVPIIAVTAHAMPEHRKQLIDAGCCSYVSKPISYCQFLGEIQRVLQLQQQPT